MHYFIDGYNLMFRYLSDEDKFQDQRQQMIEELNTKAQLLDLKMTLVFDAQYRIEDLTRSHYGSLEVVYTSFGETADECILALVKEASFPRQTVVVTSDKKLAWFARRCDAKTESVEQFNSWINKRFNNRLLKQKQPKTTPTPKPRKHLEPRIPQGSVDYYLKEFEKQFASLPPVKDKPHKPKKRSHKEQKEEENISDFKRWLRIFEQGSSDND